MATQHCGLDFGTSIRGWAERQDRPFVDDGEEADRRASPAKTAFSRSCAMHGLTLRHVREIDLRVAICRKDHSTSPTHCDNQPDHIDNLKLPNFLGGRL